MFLRLMVLLGCGALESSGMRELGPLPEYYLREGADSTKPDAEQGFLLSPLEFARDVTSNTPNPEEQVFAFSPDPWF